MAKKKTNVDTDQDEGSGGSMAVNDAWTGLLAISLLALMTGAGFLGYDWWQYYDDKEVPRPPYLTGKAPGAPPVIRPPEKKPEDPPKDGKKDDKKDAALRRTLDAYGLNSIAPSAAPALVEMSARTRRSSAPSVL